MLIKSLQLENFRCYKKYSIDFSDTTILIGPNGVGKTNIIEAVWMASCGRSWRTSRDLETVLWEKEFSKININAENKNKKINLEIFFQNPNGFKKAQGKILKINGVKHRLIDLLGQLPAVLFSPESLELVGGSPALRRKFLDIMLSQINHRYAINLLEYQKVLRERNKLLFFIKEGRSKADELKFWDEKLVETGKYIIDERKKAIDFINSSIGEAYKQIAGNDEKLKLILKESVKSEKFAEELKKIKEREVERAGTLIGPHRDDWEFLLNNKNITFFGSRGEYRSAILSLKIMEMKFLESKINEKPILLLDDVFSEFDAKRRKHLGELTEKCQVIVTTTDLEHIDGELRKKAKIIELKRK